LCIDGYIYWVIERKGGVATSIDLRFKNEIQPILAHNAKNAMLRPDLIGWEAPNGKKYPPSDILMVTNYNPNYNDPISAYTGLSPLTAARLSLESEFSIAGWNSSFFRSGMKNPLLIQAKGQLSREQKAEIRREIVNYYSGIDGAHGALLMQGGVEVKPLVVNPKDIDFINGKKLNREEILAIFGVPPSIVGIFEFSNYSNTREQIRIFWEHTLLPKMNFLLELIQFNILDKDFPGISAKWDLSQVKGLATDPVELAAPAKTYQDMGYSASQVAKILNCPTLEPDKDFEKPEPKEIAPPNAGNPLNPASQNPKKPTKPVKPAKPGDPKPSNKPKPDNNNDFSYFLERNLKNYVENVSLENSFTILQLWEDLVEDLIKQHYEVTQEMLESLKGVPQTFLNCPTESMHSELEKNIDNIVVLIRSMLYNVERRL
jgi:HK97 family phage portal protein